MELKTEISPSTLTILTTYQCNAACKECCFECSPKVTSRLSKEQIIKTIDQAVSSFPDLIQVVFSGGECFLLKQDLYESIQYCTSKGLLTRCVTNGFWARNKDKAEEIVSRLSCAGLNEINISTGLDHQKWVSVDTVVTAAKTLVQNDIFTLVSVETDTDQSKCLESLMDKPTINQLLKSKDKFQVQSNAWMPFHSDSVERNIIPIESIDTGCNQLFNNCVVTANGEVSACCGLTLEHIPELKLGSINDLNCFTTEQEYDFLKLWLYVDGAIEIIRIIMGEEFIRGQNIHHQCQACVILHKNQQIRKLIKVRYKEFIVSVLNRHYIQKNGLQLT